MGSYFAPIGTMGAFLFVGTWGAKAMEYYYDIWEFRFVDKQTRMGCVVYARTLETALEIIKLWNDMQSIYQWVKPKFRFKKKYITTMPPYELEQEQIKTIKLLKK